MADNGLPEKEHAPGIYGETGSSVKGILILLLALGVCFSYFYFFTDVLRPNEETPIQTGVSSSEVKKPLPARAVQAVVTSAAQTVRVAPASPVPPAGIPAAPAVNGQKQAPSPIQESPVAPAASSHAPAKSGTVASKPAPSTTKPAPVSSKQKEPAGKVTAAETRKADSGKASHTAASPKPAGKTVTGSTATSTSLSQKKNAVVEPKSVSVSPAKQKAAPDKQVAVKEKVSGDAGKAVSKKEEKGFSLVVGTYVLQSTLKADKAKLERAGLHPSVVAGPKKNQPMNRLVVAEFDSFATARSELDKVKKASKDAFILHEDGKFTVYAGSYYRHDRAEEEQGRLQAQGFAPILKKSVAPVGTWKLTVGGFPTRAAAQEEAAKLRKLGFKPVPTQSRTK